MLLKKLIILWAFLALLSGQGGAAAAISNESTLRYGVYALPLSLDPAWGTTVSDSILRVNIYEGLTTYDAAGNVVPGAAHRWEVSDDGLHYTFYLRKGLRWSDGSPVIAQQFANTVLRVLKGDGESQPTFHYTLLKNANEILQQQQPLSALGMKVVDKHTLSFELARPAPYFLETLVSTALPTPGVVDDTLPPKELKPVQWVTNGAYQVSTYDPQKKQYLFSKNPYYRESQQIYFKSVQVKRYPKPNEALFALLNGRIDSYDRGNHFKTMGVGNELIKVVPLGASSTIYLVINVRDKILKDLRIRQALALSLDRSAIVKALGYSDTQRAFSFSPDYPEANWQKLPAIWGKEPLKQRRQRALALMAEAGYDLSHRLQLEFLVNIGDTNELLAELVRRQWATIGVDLTVISQSTAVHYGEYLGKNRFQVARAGWSDVYPDPSSFLEILHQHQQNNMGRWAHTAYSQQLDQLLQQPLPPKQRTAAFLKLETIIQQEVPIIPIYNQANVALLAPWLKTVNQQRGGDLLWRHFRPEESNH